MRKSLLLLVLFCMGTCTSVLWAQKKVTGMVTDKDANAPLIGANVIVKGTTNGTVTDLDGKYTIEVNDNGTLVFSFLGLETKEVPVAGKNVVNVTLGSGALNIDEVVVTAMGIKRESKTLTYAAQTVGGKELNEIKNVNMINSLQGKSAGLQITPNSTGAGGASKILLRGNKSINGSNQPLIVVDGVPLMMNVSDSQVSSNYGGGRDGGDAMSTINPDDIAQLTLLKGASAAALYGAVAANGAIMITTKSAQAGKVAINVSSNTTVENVMSLPKFQNNYGMSNSGTFSWGDKLSAAAPNYAKEFFRTGYTTNNSISLAGGNENIQSYFSYANVASNGVTPKNEYMSHNLLAKVGFDLWKKVHVDVSARYNNQHIENQSAAGFLTNPITGAYLFPRGENWNDYKTNYEVYDPTLNASVQNWTNTKQEQFSNPYWMVNRQKPVSDRNRYEFGGSIKYEIMTGLSVAGRLRYERGDEKWIYNEYASSTGGRNLLGSMKDSRIFSEQMYGDLLASYNKTWDEKYSLSVTAGGSFTKTTGSSVDLIGWGDSKFVVIDGKPTGNAYYPNIFSPANYYRLNTSESLKEKRLNSVFATAQFGYMDGLFLDVTARNDWSSALAFTDGMSFFYPSVGVSALLDKFINFGKNVDLFKFRASYSVVGNDVPVFMTNLRYSLKDQGSLTPPDKAPFKTLKPEKTNSLEIGFDGVFFQNRLNANLTYYKTNTKNQFFSISAPWETGLRNRYVNAGDVQNQGFEIALGWHNQFTTNFSWNTNFNFSYNVSKIKKLVEELPKGLVLADYGGAKIIMKEGGYYGDLYVRQIARDDNGKPLVSDGSPRLGGDGIEDLKYVGDMNAKVNMGWSNTFNYKDFSLSFLIDAKVGGKVLSMTEATLDGWGVSERSGAARDNGGVEFEGVKFDAQKFYSSTGATNFNSQYANELYVYNATNVRLRELSFGYTFRNLMGTGKHLSASLIGRNLFFFYKDAPMDPDVSAGTGNGWQGVDMFALPASRSFGLNLKLNF
ncbi:MAG: SusC/RagA family TonB-linked outer membrane protein [Tannerellaceae bacterium]